MNVLQFLEGLTKAFPLNTMGPGFRGAHGITLGTEHHLTVGVWIRGRCYQVHLDGEDVELSESTLAHVVSLVTEASTPIPQPQ